MTSVYSCNVRIIFTSICTAGKNVLFTSFYSVTVNIMFMSFCTASRNVMFTSFCNITVNVLHTSRCNARISVWQVLRCNARINVCHVLLCNARITVWQASARSTGIKAMFTFSVVSSTEGDQDWQNRGCWTGLECVYVAHFCFCHSRQHNPYNWRSKITPGVTGHKASPP